MLFRCIILIVVLAACTMFAREVSADAFTNPVTVHQINVGAGPDHFFVVTDWNVCGSTAQQFFNTSAEVRNRAYATVLAAFLAGKRIQLYTSVCSGQNMLFSALAIAD